MLMAQRCVVMMPVILILVSMEHVISLVIEVFNALVCLVLLVKHVMKISMSAMIVSYALTIMMSCNFLVVCLNGGTCENMHGGFVCHCPNGYYGDLCEDNCLCPAGTKCSNNSQCVAIANENNLHIKKSVVNNITLLDNIVNTLLENPSVSFTIFQNYCFHFYRVHLSHDKKEMDLLLCVVVNL